MEAFLIGIGVTVGIFFILFWWNLKKFNHLLEDTFLQVTLLDARLDRLIVQKEKEKDLYVPPKSVQKDRLKIEEKVKSKDEARSKSHAKKISEGLKRYHAKRKDSVDIRLT